MLNSFLVDDYSRELGELQPSALELLKELEPTELTTGCTDPHWLSERELEGVQRTKDKLSSLYVNNHNESELIRVFEGSFPQQHCCHINTQAFVAYSGLPVVYKEGWVYDSSSRGRETCLMYHAWAEYNDGTRVDVTSDAPYITFREYKPGGRRHRQNKVRCLDRVAGFDKYKRAGKHREYIKMDRCPFFNMSEAYNPLPALEEWAEWARARDYSEYDILVISRITQLRAREMKERFETAWHSHWGVYAEMSNKEISRLLKHMEEYKSKMEGSM